MRALLDRGETVVIVDSLATGHPGAVDPRAEFHKTDLRDRERLLLLFAEVRPGAVVHFAASSLVGPSVTDPLPTYDNNLVGALNLLEAMRQQSTPHLVFSSTAAVYGEPQEVPIPETHPVAPGNPYGASKAMIEQLIRDCGVAYGLKSVVLRYFNAAGAVPERGEDHRPETHLIPLILQAALGQRESISVFGTDYDTPDGTAIRDYIHVADLARAHLAAIDRLRAGGDSLTCNLGTGQGHSVQEVIETARRVTGRDIPVVHVPRRAGDPSRLVAAADRARMELQWTPVQSDLESILKDAWNWMLSHPRGYDSIA